MSNGAESVTVCVPYFRSRPYIRRAVESVLKQTHENVKVVVINDADPDPPWDCLADIDDARLVRADLSSSHGPYFATAVVLAATRDRFLLIQDADDWSAPERVSCLLRQLTIDASDFAFSATARYDTAGEEMSFTGFEWSVRPDTRVTPSLKYRFPHHGLWRVASLLRVGGYYGGFRFSYDRFITNVIALTGRVSYVAHPLYHRRVRAGSLSTSIETGLASVARAEVDRQLGDMYRDVHEAWTRFTQRQICSDAMLQRVREVCRRNVSTEADLELREKSEQLARALT
jgi:glycosyltransferase involved in cell wall biosynthesis